MGLLRSLPELVGWCALSGVSVRAMNVDSEIPSLKIGRPMLRLRSPVRVLEEDSLLFLARGMDTYAQYGICHCAFKEDVDCRKVESYCQCKQAHVSSKR